MNPTVKKQFDSAASEYDQHRRQLIPCFDDFYGMALSLVECENPSPRILDLGAGTGLLSSFVLQKYPNAMLTLIDFSEKMLDEARQRFHHADNVQYIVADYSNYEFDTSYDFVISSLSIHHLPHPAKQQLFSNVFQILSPGGVFVNADQIQGRTAATDAYYRKRWLSALAQSTLPPEAIDASVERRKVDINATLEDQITWLEQAGFSEVDCMYKYFDFGVFFSRKD